MAEKQLQNLRRKEICSPRSMKELLSSILKRDMRVVSKLSSVCPTSCCEKLSFYYKDCIFDTSVKHNGIALNDVIRISWSKMTEWFVFGFAGIRYVASLDL